MKLNFKEYVQTNEVFGRLGMGVGGLVGGLPGALIGGGFGWAADKYLNMDKRPTRRSYNYNNPYGYNYGYDDGRMRINPDHAEQYVDRSGNLKYRILPQFRGLYGQK